MNRQMLVIAQMFMTCSSSGTEMQIIDPVNEIGTKEITINILNLEVGP